MSQRQWLIMPSPSLARTAEWRTRSFSPIHRMALVYSSFLSTPLSRSVQASQIHLPLGALFKWTHCRWYHTLPTHLPRDEHSTMASPVTLPQQQSSSPISWWWACNNGKKAVWLIGNMIISISIIQIFQSTCAAITLCIRSANKNRGRVLFLTQAWVLLKWEFTQVHI